MWFRMIVAAVLLQSSAMAIDGELDNSFDGDGKVMTDIGSMAQARAVIVQKDGKIVTAGFLETDPSNSENNISVLRYDSNGSLDKTFGNAGKVSVNIGITSEARAVALQSDGKIVIAGTNRIERNSAYVYSIILARFKTDGTLDKDFGVNGFVTTESETGNYAEANSIAIYDDDKIVVAGTTTEDFVVAKYLPDGAPDNSFGGNGIVTTDVKGEVDMAHGVVIQNDGKIVVSGEAGGCLGQSFAIVRYKANGDLDDTFGTKGIVTTEVGDGPHDFGGVIVLQKNGKYVLAGRSWDGNRYLATLLQYHKNGDLDEDFGEKGIVKTH